MNLLKTILPFIVPCLLISSVMADEKNIQHSFRCDAVTKENIKPMERLWLNGIVELSSAMNVKGYSFDANALVSTLYADPTESYVIDYIKLGVRTEDAFVPESGWIRANFDNVIHVPVINGISAQGVLALVDIDKKKKMLRADVVYVCKNGIMSIDYIRFFNMSKRQRDHYAL